MFGSQGILNKQLNAISKEKPNFWTMKQEKGTLIQYSTVNSQIRLITGSWSSLVNEKPSITILFLAKPAPGIFDWFYCLGHGISKRHGSSLDPRAMRPFSLRQHLSLKGLYTAFCVFVEASTTRVHAAVVLDTMVSPPKVCTRMSPAPQDSRYLWGWGSYTATALHFRETARNSFHPQESNALLGVHRELHQDKICNHTCPRKTAAQNNQSTCAHSPEGKLRVEFTPISILPVTNNLHSTSSKPQAADKGGLHNTTAILWRVQSQ